MPANKIFTVNYFHMDIFNNKFFPNYSSRLFPFSALSMTIGKVKDKFDDLLGGVNLKDLFN